ncbi:MAG: O-antigen ligase family protein [Candidatus Korobacteraceae bacterium]
MKSVQRRQKSVQQEEQRRPDPVLGIIFPILLVFLAFVFTGAPELVGFLRSTRPVLFVGVMGLLAVAVTGKFMRVVQSPIGKVLTAFTIWFMICIPMAIWRGGSIQTFTDYWSKSFLAYVLVAGLVSTPQEARKVFHTIAYSVGILALLSLAAHAYTEDGRLYLPNGRYANSNDLAWTLLVGLIFLAYLYMDGNVFRKVVAAALAVPVLMALQKTGSRALMVGAAMLILYAFIKSSGANRIKLLIVVPALMAVIIVTMPKELLERYSTLFGKHVTQLSEAQVDAAGSSETRLQLLKDSLYLTVVYPLFGVGPGNFQVAQNDLAIKRGKAGGLWHVTHNSYTELSCEVGIPGLLIYLIFLVQCWRVLSSIMRKRYVSKDVRLMAKVLQAAFLVMAVVAFFESFAYDVNIPIVAGLITALSFIAQRQKPLKSAPRPEEAIPPALPEPEYEPAWSGRLY